MPPQFKGVSSPWEPSQYWVPHLQRFNDYRVPRARSVRIFGGGAPRAELRSTLTVTVLGEDRPRRYEQTMSLDANGALIIQQ